jgi:hypothetical protein
VSWLFRQRQTLAFLAGEFPWLDQRTKAELDLVLEGACRDLPHGGDHHFRKTIATKLINSARKGNTTLGGLVTVARNAVAEGSARRTA